MPDRTTKALRETLATLSPEMQLVVERLSTAMEHVAEAQNNQSKLIEKMSNTLEAMDKRITYFEVHEVTAQLKAHELRITSLETVNAIKTNERQLVASVLGNKALPWLVAAASAAFGAIALFLLKHPLP